MCGRRSFRTDLVGTAPFHSFRMHTYFLKTDSGETGCVFVVSLKGCNPSKADTIGEIRFVHYSEVSFMEGYAGFCLRRSFDNCIAVIINLIINGGKFIKCPLWSCSEASAVQRSTAEAIIVTCSL